MYTYRPLAFAWRRALLWNVQPRRWVLIPHLILIGSPSFLYFVASSMSWKWRKRKEHVKITNSKHTDAIKMNKNENFKSWKCQKNIPQLGLSTIYRYCNLRRSYNEGNGAMTAMNSNSLSTAGIYCSFIRVSSNFVSGVYFLFYFFGTTYISVFENFKCANGHTMVLFVGSLISSSVGLVGNWKIERVTV